MKELSIKQIVILLMAALAGFIALFLYWGPVPSKKIVIATGSPSGLYYQLGKRFEKALAKEGIELEVRQTAGTMENLALLNDPNSDVSLAFAQGGVAGDAANYPNINSLAGMYYEPLWIIYRPEAFNKKIDHFSDLDGRKVSIGNVGSGTLSLATNIFKLNQIDIDQSGFQKLSADQAYKKLGENELDAIMIVAAAEAPIMEKIFKDKRFKLMNLEHVKAYPPRLPYLKDISIDRGVLNIVNRQPEQVLSVLAPTAELVAKKSLHPAFVAVMLDASYEILQSNSILQSQKEFPSSTHLDFELNDDAARYMSEGPSFLHKNLPFWVAVWADRLIKIAIPLVAILFPLFNIVPALFSYRIRLMFAQMYEELRRIEAEALKHKDLDDLRVRFEQIESKVKQMKIPRFSSKDLYDLRSHIDYVKERFFK
jgi:TRAP-type uncharacterized transport system substrate-binding protein